jgi:3-oxoacyl-[acyl-carrier protein] reductase
MTDDFFGKTAIVTGGTRGIGKCIVQLLSCQGCDVIYTGTKRSSDDNIRGARFEQLDLADVTSINRFVKEIIEPHPGIDILVNNAGINKIEPIDEISDDDWTKILTVNLTGAMRMTRAVSKNMKNNKKGGRILNISSIFGVVSKSRRNAYSASKTGLIGLTRASALDLAPDHILVNALCPGFTMTELTQSVLSKKDMEELRREVPLGRFAEVDEIARAALFLCSCSNTYITGQTLVVDGGFTIR